MDYSILKSHINDIQKAAILYTACGKYPQWMHEKLVDYANENLNHNHNLNLNDNLNLN